MKLIFSKDAEAAYRQWKRKSGEDYLELKSVILDCIQSPLSGKGSPKPLGKDYGEYWTRTFGKNLHIVYTADNDNLRVEAISPCRRDDTVIADEDQHKNAVELMRRFMDNGEPKLGIFWYNYEQNVLFGVLKGDAGLYADQGRLSTYPKLHKTYWQKMHRKALRDGDKTSVFYGEHDYTQIPRGRVFLENRVFYVNVGDWINGYVNGKKCIDKENLRELLIDEFNLPEDFQFRQDEHWDIGHGWSEEQF